MPDPAGRFRAVANLRGPDCGRPDGSPADDAGPDEPRPRGTSTQNLTVNATVSATASLTLGSGSINFAAANPTTTPSIAANENAVSVTANAQTSSSGAVT